MDLLLYFVLKWWIDSNDWWGKVITYLCLRSMPMFDSCTILCGKMICFFPSTINCTWMLLNSEYLIYACPPMSACLPSRFLSINTRLWSDLKRFMARYWLFTIDGFKIMNNWIESGLITTQILSKILLWWSSQYSIIICSMCKQTSVGRRVIQGLWASIFIEGLCWLLLSEQTFAIEVCLIKVGECWYSLDSTNLSWICILDTRMYWNC